MILRSSERSRKIIITVNDKSYLKVVADVAKCKWCHELSKLTMIGVTEVVLLVGGWGLWALLQSELGSKLKKFKS